MKRLTFTPDELAGGFDTLQRAGKVQGMFLSSGIIKGGVTTQDKIIETAEIVRRRYGYSGYLHLHIAYTGEAEGRKSLTLTKQSERNTTHVREDHHCSLSSRNC